MITSHRRRKITKAIKLLSPNAHICHIRNPISSWRKQGLWIKTVIGYTPMFLMACIHNHFYNFYEMYRHNISFAMNQSMHTSKCIHTNPHKHTHTHIYIMLESYFTHIHHRIYRTCHLVGWNIWHWNDISHICHSSNESHKQNFILFLKCRKWSEHVEK